MLTITAGEFNANQQHYLDQVDEGEELIVKRSHGKSFMIVPITEEDTTDDAEYIMEPDEDLEQAVSFDEILEGVYADIHEMFKDKRTGKK